MSTAVELKAEDLAEWGEPKRVIARGEPKDLLTAEPNDKFGDLWKDPKMKEQLRAMGLGWSKRPNGWKIVWWRSISEGEQAEKIAAVEQSSATDAAIDIPAPDGLEYLGYQKAGIEYALKHEGTLIGDEMGLGKTIQAIGVINSDPTVKTVLIICPAILKINWQRELEKWLTRSFRVARASGQFWPDGAEIVIINYDIVKKMHKYLTAKEWDLIVLDESQYIKNPKAQRTKLIVGNRGRSLKDRVEGIRGKRKLALTGTPIMNRPIELFTVLEWLKKGAFGSYMNFAYRYCDAQNNGFGLDASGASNLDELQQRLRSELMVRRLKKDVLTELPAKRRQVIELPVGSTLRKAVAAEATLWEASEEVLAKVQARVEMAKVSDDAGEYSEAITALREAQQVAFESMSQVRHETGMRKLPMVVEHIKDQIEAGGNPLIFAHHKDVVAQLRAELSKFNPAVVVGGMGEEAKQREVDRFMDDPTCQCFIGSIKAANAGLNLTKSSLVIFAEMDWTPGVMAQCEDRAHRIGQLDSVLIQYLVLEGSVDAHVANTNVRKMSVISRALDGGTAEGMEVISTLDSVSVSPAELEQVSAPRKAKAQERAKMMIEFKPGQIAAILKGLRSLAGVCDGAKELDGSGFSKVDAYIGHSFARMDALSPKQALLGMKLVNKYRRQLDRDLVAQAKGEA